MKTSKILSLMLAIVMMLGIALPLTVSAADITIDDGDSFANTYEAYRLMDLQTVVTCGDTHTHTDDCYGYAYTLRLGSESANAAKIRTAVLDALNIVPGTMTEAQINAAVIAAINAMTDDPSDGRTFAADTRKMADALYAALKDAGAAADATSSSESFTGLPQGYYLIVDTTNPLEDGDANSKFILDTMGQNNITINAKKDVPTVDKDLWKHNGSTISTDATPADDTTGAWAKETDVNIGDVVFYKVPGTLPSNLQDFVKYYYGITDTMSLGLTYQNDMKVTYYASAADADSQTDGEDVTAFFTTTATAGATNTVLTSVCADILDADGLSEDITVTKNGIFVFEYSAKLNDEAVIGNPGNPNEVFLTYSSNPNLDGDGEPNDETNDTPEVFTVVFTYQLDVTKTDTNDAPITTDTAKFVAYRMNGTDKEYVVLDASNNVASWTLDKDLATQIETSAASLFSIIGLDAGTYYLEETKAPSGYNLLTDPIEFVIAATIEEISDNYEITELTITVDGGTAADGNVATGIVPMAIQNGTGPKFPGTGGIGRTLFIIGGLLLIGVCTGAFIVYKKKSSLDSLNSK